MDLLSKLPKITDRKAKRLGRGSGSGKGDKATHGGKRHQKAREKIPLFFEGGQNKMVKKYPLLRGKSKNKSIQNFVELNLDVLNKFDNNEKVDLAALFKKGILRKSQKNVKVKILSTGKLEKKVIVKLPVTDGARKKIEKAGGKIE